MNNNSTPLKDIAKKFNLPEQECYRKFLDFGNKHNVKVLAEDAGRIFVHDSLASHLYEEDEHAQSLLVDREVIIPSSSVPIEKAHYIYFLLSLGQIVYIGQSRSLLSRIGTHTGNKCFDEVFCVPVDPLDQDMTEEVCLMYYKPPLNVTIWDDRAYFTRLLYRCGSFFKFAG